MSHTWNQDRALKYIESQITALETVEVKDYVRDMSLENIKINSAYRVDGVHMYADIQNFEDILRSSDIEGEMSHKRALRFLDLHYRAVTQILDSVEAVRVDFHGQRLHALVAKPYNSETDAEKKRIQRAIAIASLIIDVLEETGDFDENIDNAKLRIGIDSGLSLAVNNGRKGNKEPLFLGNPANYAAKLASNNSAQGIYLTNNARKALGLIEVDKPETTRLTKTEIDDCINSVELGVTVEEIVNKWKEKKDKYRLADYSFSRQSPPLKNLPIDELTPLNTKHQEMISSYADIDGFTAYVSNNIQNNAEDVIRTLHVLRSELERVVTVEFSGRRVRFIGDCIHALSYEGTTQTLDEESSISYAVLMAGALRSSFQLGIKKLIEAGYKTGILGLSIGFDLGPISVSRLGMQGRRIRCAIGRKVLESEKMQCKCSGTETSIGLTAFERASEAVRELFGSKRKIADLTYNEAVEALIEYGDKTVNSVRLASFTDDRVTQASLRSVKPHLDLIERR
jgi:class 3 adenylate cyclase